MQKGKNRVYRTISDTDSLPRLPEKIKPLYILENEGAVLIFGVDKNYNYTVTWDGISNDPTHIAYLPKANEAADLYDPAVNVELAYRIWSGQGWKPWGAYTSGVYLNFTK